MHPIITALRLIHENFDGRFVRFPERLEIAAKLAVEQKFSSKEIAEVLSNNVLSDIGTTHIPDVPVSNARFGVNWISQLDDGLEWLFKIALNGKLAWYVRQEAFLCIAHLRPGDEVFKSQWVQVCDIAADPETISEVREAALTSLVDNQIQEASRSSGHGCSILS